MHSIDKFFSPVRKKGKSDSSQKITEHDLSFEDTSLTSTTSSDDKIKNSEDCDIEILNDNMSVVSSHDSVSEVENNFERENVDNKNENCEDGAINNREEISENKSNFIASDPENKKEIYNSIPSISDVSISEISVEDIQNSSSENVNVFQVESEQMRTSTENDSQDNSSPCVTDKLLNDVNVNIETTEDNDEDNEHSTVDYISELSPKNNTSCENVKLVVIKTDDGQVENCRRKFSQMTVNIEDIKNKIENRKKRNAERNKTQTLVKFRAEIDPSKNKSAEQELQKEISKDMFAKVI